MKSISERLSQQLFEPARTTTQGEILFFRFFELFVISYVIFLSWKWGLYIPRNSDVVLPLGIANHIDVSFMFSNSVSVINAILISIFVMLAFFRQGARWFYPATMLLFHLQYAGRFSQGEISHSSNLIGMSLFCLSMGFIFFQDDTKQRRFILGILIFFTGLGYTSAAFTKLIATGIHWSDGNHLWLWVAEKRTDILSRTGTFHYDWLQKLTLGSHLTATIILSLGWITELSGFLIWWKKPRPYVITGLICTHIGITLIMDIRFDAFVYELILLGYPWARLIDKYISYIRMPSIFNR